MKIVSRQRWLTAVRKEKAEGEAVRSGTRRRAGQVLLGLTVAATAAALAVPASASASASTDVSRVVGHVYVDDNTAGANTIGAFNRHADGTLTPEAGSPFAAGGAGTGAGLASQGAVQISPDGRFLYVDESRIGTVGTFAVNGGNLTELAGSPTSLPAGATPAGIVTN
jgi:6-phosphogluconolactonase